jgi:hypothetical protein
MMTNRDIEGNKVTTLVLAEPGQAGEVLELSSQSGNRREAS